MSNMINKQSNPLDIDPFVTSCESCSIKRDTDGSYRVTHQEFPGRIWSIANLPTAYALCTDLSHGRYQDLAGMNSGT